VLSDLHIEFEPFSPPLTDVDVVILAGDIGLKTRGIEWAANAFRNPITPSLYIPCLYIPGNHEYYGGELGRNLVKMREAAAKTPNIKVLDCDEVIIDDVRFLGATAWTDYTATGNAPMAKLAATALADFKKIRSEQFKRVNPEHFAYECRKAKAWFMRKLEEPFAGHTVGITHHAPSVESLNGHPDAGTHLDASFANRWEDILSGFDLFVHGHNHQRADYDVYGCRVVSNQRGYPGEVVDFDPSFVIDTDTFRKKP
jgi:DNA repair exonuclease SbcCD nuclease subunit